MQNDQTGSAFSRPPADPARSTEDLKSAAHDAGAAVQSAIDDSADKLKQAASEARDQGAEKVNAASDGAASALRKVSDQLKGAADGLGGEQPWAGKAFQTGADGLDRVSDYLSSGQFEDFARDVQAFARANPAAFLAGSVALGFLVARVGKTAAHHATDGPGSTTNTPTPNGDGMSAGRFDPDPGFGPQTAGDL